MQRCTRAKQSSETGATHVVLCDNIGDNLTCPPELDATHVTTWVNLNKDCAQKVRNDMC